MTIQALDWWCKILKILVTGGAGYIGSHTCVELLNGGHELVVYDNLHNSKYEVIDRIHAITGKQLTFVEGDILDSNTLARTFNNHATINAVVHFAGLKAVSESTQKPLFYYDNNVGGSLTLLKVMEEYGCRHIVFSSSATVYGKDAPTPYIETLPTNPYNVYGRTKLIVENILRDCCSTAKSCWHVSLLRYFNPIGAHKSGMIGEDPNGIPNNLLPYITQVAIGKLQQLQVFGNDYPTHDGTGVRDYIHVVDLARGHVKALQKLLKSEPGHNVYNLGSGHGYSVMEVIRAFEKANRVKIPYTIANRREGDLPEFYADASLALTELDWRAELDLEQMVTDTWRWQSQNPSGY